ncbi:MAG: hemolysin family protein [Chloroflexota bacterium]|nr:hemolysin family protein [Chloroflexota bacterium]
MDSASIVVGVSIAAAALVIAFAAAAEVSIGVLSKFHARHLLDEGVNRAQAVQSLLEDPARLVTTLMVLKAGANIVAAGGVTWFIMRDGTPEWYVVPLALLVTWFAMLCVQIVGRAIAVRSTETAALRLSTPVRLTSVLLTPITAALRGLGNLAMGPTSEINRDALFLSEDGLRFLINGGDEPGLIEDDEKEMIAGIFELGHTLVREVMVPRIDIAAIGEDTTLRDALDVFINAGHSRIPVYRDNIDNVLGVLYAKDLLPSYRDGQHDVPIVQLMRPAYFVPESKKVDDFLNELQQRKVHMALVVDEYGGIAGVVTIEDLIEEIVGEIQDEYDTEVPMVVQEGENEYLFEARVDLDDASKVLGIELPTDESDTLGGFIYSQLGSMPIVGSQVDYGNYRFVVRTVSGRRIHQVKATRLAPAEEDASSEAASKNSSLSTYASLF